MPAYRLLVATYKSAEPPRDRVVNTFFLRQTIGEPIQQEDAQALCNDAADLFAEYRVLPAGWDRIEARIYDMDDAEPRAPLHTRVRAVANNAGAAGPREVALCLSFYSELNRPRSRGRMYIGPWTSAQMAERPGLTAGAQASDLAALADGIANLGGIDIDWQIYSTRDDEFKKVTHWWVDNEWDTMRSRGLRGDARLTGTTSE